MSTPQPEGLSKLSRDTRHYALVGYFFRCFTRMETALDRAVEECSRLSFSLHLEATRHMSLEAKAHVLSAHIGAAALNRYQGERYLKYSREAALMQGLSEKLVRYRVQIVDNDNGGADSPRPISELQPVSMNELEVIRYAQRCDYLARCFLEVVDAFAQQTSGTDKVELSALEVEQITNEIMSTMS